MYTIRTQEAMHMAGHAHGRPCTWPAILHARGHGPCMTCKRPLQPPDECFSRFEFWTLGNEIQICACREYEYYHTLVPKFKV